MKVKTGDNIVVIAGKDKGKRGKIARILRKKNQVIVEKINIRTKHIKKTAQKAGERIQYEAPINASNVMIIDPSTKKRARIGHKILETGKKQRIYSKSKEEIKTTERKIKAKTT